MNAVLFISPFELGFIYEMYFFRDLSFSGYNTFSSNHPQSSDK